MNKAAQQETYITIPSQMLDKKNSMTSIEEEQKEKGRSGQGAVTKEYFSPSLKRNSQFDGNFQVQEKTLGYEPLIHDKNLRTQVFGSKDFQEISQNATQITQKKQVTFIAQQKQNLIEQKRVASQSNQYTNIWVSPLIPPETKAVAQKAVTMVMTSCAVNDDVNSVSTLEKNEKSVQQTNSENISNTDRWMVPKIQTSSILYPNSRTYNTIQDDQGQIISTTLYSFEKDAQDIPLIQTDQTQEIQNEASKPSKQKSGNDLPESKQAQFSKRKSSQLAKIQPYASITSSSTEKLKQFQLYTIALDHQTVKQNEEEPLEKKRKISQSRSSAFFGEAVQNLSAKASQMKNMINAKINQTVSFEALHKHFSNHMARRNNAANIKTHEVKTRAGLYAHQCNLSPRETTSQDLAMRSKISSKDLAQVQKQQYHERIFLSKQSLLQNRIMMTDGEEWKLSLFNRKQNGPTTADHAKKNTFSSKKIVDKTVTAQRASLIKIIKDQQQAWDQKIQNQSTLQEEGNKNLDHEVPYEDSQGVLRPNMAISEKSQTRQKSFLAKNLSILDLANIRVVVSERKKFEENHLNVNLAEQNQDKSQPTINNATKLREVNQNIMASSNNMNQPFKSLSPVAYQSIDQNNENSFYSNTQANGLSIVISNDRDLAIEKERQEYIPPVKQNWKSYVRDEGNLIKGHKNAFGSKSYKLNFDKSTLSQHVNHILKSNLKSKAVQFKPYLLKQTSAENMSQELIQIRDSAELQIEGNHVLGQNSDNIMQVRRSTESQSSQEENVYKVTQQKKHERRHQTTSTRVDKLKGKKRQPDSYTTKGYQYRSRKEHIEGSAKVNSTTMAQWLRHCSPNAIQAQLLKLQALGIDKLDIDYKIVDRSVEERPYLVTSDESGDESSEENDQNTGNQSKEEQTPKGARPAKVLLSEDCKHKRSSISTKQLTLQNKKREVSSLSNERLNQLQIQLQTQSDTQLRGSKYILFKDAAGHLQTETYQTLPKEGSSVKVNDLQGIPLKLASHRLKARSKRRQRNRLPISPALSLLKQPPSQEVIKLAQLMNKVQSPSSRDIIMQQLTTQFDSIDSQSNQKGANIQAQQSSKSQIQTANTKAPNYDSLLTLYNSKSNPIGQNKQLKNSFRSYQKVMVPQVKETYFKSQGSEQQNKITPFKRGTRLINDGSVKFVADIGGLPQNISLRHSPTIQPKKEYDSIKFVQRPKQVPIKPKPADLEKSKQKRLSRVSSDDVFFDPKDSQHEMPVQKNTQIVEQDQIQQTRFTPVTEPAKKEQPILQFKSQGRFQKPKQSGQLAKNAYFPKLI